MSSVITLVSGGNAALNAENPLLTDLVVGFGWEVIKSNSPQSELVPSAIMCDHAGRALAPDSMVFFNQLATTDGSVQYVTAGDTEQIEVDLALIPAAVDKIVFVVYVDPDIRRPGSFASVRHAYIRVADREDNDIVRYTLDAADSGVTAMIFGEIYRYRGAWKFRAVGQGYTTGLMGVTEAFGLEL